MEVKDLGGSALLWGSGSSLAHAPFHQVSKRLREWLLSDPANPQADKGNKSITSLARVEMNITMSMISIYRGTT